MTLLKSPPVSVPAQRIRLGLPQANIDDSLAGTGPSESERRLRQLEDALREASAREDELRRTMEQREREARQQGRDEGEKAAVNRQEQDWSQRTDAFLKALTTCTAQVDQRFAELEAFALDLAECALASLLGDPAQYAPLLSASIRHHAGRLVGDTVLAIHVCATDLPDATLLAGSLPTALASRVKTSTDLAPGTCRVELTSGSMDLGLAAQAARLAQTMDRLRQP